MRNKEVILDTNLWISFLISKKLKDIDNLIDSGKIILIFSNESIEEFLTVAKRPKFKNYALLKREPNKPDIGLIIFGGQEAGSLAERYATEKAISIRSDYFLLPG